MGIFHVLWKLAPFAVKSLQVSTDVGLHLKLQTVHDFAVIIQPGQGSQYRIYSNKTY